MMYLRTDHCSVVIELSAQKLQTHQIARLFYQAQSLKCTRNLQRRRTKFLVFS